MLKDFCDLSDWGEEIPNAESDRDFFLWGGGGYTMGKMFAPTFLLLLFLLMKFSGFEGYIPFIPRGSATESPYSETYLPKNF